MGTGRDVSTMETPNMGYTCISKVRAREKLPFVMPCGMWHEIARDPMHRPRPFILLSAYVFTAAVSRATGPPEVRHHRS